MNEDTSNNISTVRQLLIDQMKSLRAAAVGGHLKEELARSRGLAELAEAVTATAKVEVDYIAAVKGASESPFLQAPDEPTRPQIPSAPQSPLPAPGDPVASGPAPDHPWRGTRVIHRLKG